jgi:hypothetical protein
MGGRFPLGRTLNSVSQVKDDFEIFQSDRTGDGTRLKSCHFSLEFFLLELDPFCVPLLFSGGPSAIFFDDYFETEN